MSYVIRILSPSEKEFICSYEQKKLKDLVSDPMEREFASWNAPWRAESLSHYLASGWSVGVWRQDCNLSGYFLGQVLLFYRGHTQVLWIEHVSFDSEKDREILVDTALRYAREKHLQSVFMPNSDGSIEETATTKR